MTHAKRLSPIWNVNKNSMDLMEATTFLSLQCLPSPQQHDRELALFLLALIQMSPATTAKITDKSKTTAENSKEKKNKSATTCRIPRRSIQNVQLATKRTNRRNVVAKTLEPTSSSKTSKWRTLKKTMRP